MNLPHSIAGFLAWAEFDFGFDLGIAPLVERDRGIIYF